MVEQKWGDFTVRRLGDAWASEMMLHCHGGYYPDDGMAPIEADSLYFYDAHPNVLTFEVAYPIIRGEASKVRAIVGGASPVWNYKLQILSEEDRWASMSHWALRFSTGRTNWDWWEVNLTDAKSDMKTLAATMKGFNSLEGHTYTRFHFLCCRSWMGQGKPASPFGLPKLI
jgi:hypothetical protein